MQDVTVSSVVVEHPVAALQGHTQTPATLSAAEQTPLTEHEATAALISAGVEKGGSEKKRSLTMPQPHTQSGSSIGPDRDAKRRAQAMTDSMTRMRDNRYSATDLKG